MSKYFAHRLSKRLGFLFFVCVLFAAFGYAPNASAVVRVASGSGYELSAYDILSEYGEWIDLSPYGVVWCPCVEEGWAPFSDGRWIWTSYGWTWDSYEAFGEIVYHYGYWYYEDDIGWFWVPGDEWSPARVQWYTYLNYCAWAPLPPPNCFWPDPWDSWDYDVWIVVDYDHFCDGHVGHRRIAPDHYRSIIQREHVIRRAPDVRRVETVTQRQVLIRTIEKRPIDIRRDQIKVADRSVIRRDVRSGGGTSSTADMRDNRRIAPTLERRVVTPPRDVRVKREAAAPENRIRVTTPGENRSVERKAAMPAVERMASASKQSPQVERRAEAPASPARSDQASSRPETPARSEPPAQSRTVEKRSGRDDKAPQRDRSR
jgi:hypothetical protein